MLLRKVKRDLSFDSATLVLRTCSMNLKPTYPRNISTSLLIAAQLTIAKLWNSRRNPSAKKWINHGVHIQGRIFPALKNTVRSRRDRSVVKNTYYSCRGSEFDAQRLRYTPLASLGTCTHVHIPTHRHRHITKIIKSKSLKKDNLSFSGK